MKLMYDNLQGVGGFVPANYWSSTEDDSTVAWVLRFTNGAQLNDFSKDCTLYVRPVRAF
jgi:hypothetical protein